MKFPFAGAVENADNRAKVAVLEHGCEDSPQGAQARDCAGPRIHALEVIVSIFLQSLLPLEKLPEQPPQYCHGCAAFVVLAVI